jgi:hypothetical protein
MWGFSVRPMHPPEAVVIVIEGDASCSPEPLCGRQWDSHLPRPPFVHMTDNDWREFLLDMRKLVRSFFPEVRWAGARYRPHARGRAKTSTPLCPGEPSPNAARPVPPQTVGSVVLVLGLVLGMFVFHPAISPFRISFGFSACIALMALSIFGGIFIYILLTLHGRRHNQSIDALIEARCRRAQELSGASFQYVALHTSPCKPKHVRTYRAIALVPASRSNARSLPSQPAHLRTGYGATIPVAMGSCACVPVATTIAQPISVTVAPHAAARPVSPPATLLAVAVPKGIRQGDTLHIRSPDGQSVAVIVPAGVPEGSTFNVRLPPPQPAAAIVVDAVPIP